MRKSHDTVYYAQEPLWDKSGSRTHEHWVQIEKNGRRFVYSYGDERGMIESKVADNLDDLIEDFYENKNYYDMEMEVDKTKRELEVKEIVQFT